MSDLLPVILVIALIFAMAVGISQLLMVRRLRGHLNDVQTQIAETDDAIAAREAKIAEIQENVVKCDTIILKLRQDVARSESQLNEFKQQAQRYQDENNALQSEISSMKDEAIQSKALYSTISSVAFDLVFVLDSDLTVIAMNRAVDALFGDKNPLGDHLTDVIDSPDLADFIERALNEEDSLEEQIVIDRHYYKVRTQVIRYDHDQAFIGVALQDITQLVRLNRSRRDMVANISHELSTPIANIRLIIDGLFHEQDRPKRKQSIQSLRDIARETDSLQHLVQELLDLSMIESGQAIMRLVPERLTEMIDETTERLYDLLATKNLTVVKHIPQRLMVLCDRGQTRRVLLNLIRNAIKWSPEGESITISAALEDEDVLVSVFDNGPGVPEDQRERIFERFYQVDTARTKGDGSGLGLAISKHIVEAQGGRIWAEGNRDGSGGRFLFTLLNATVDDGNVPEMDRGQHDAVFNRNTPPAQSKDASLAPKNDMTDETLSES